MKKLLKGLLAAAMMLGLTACGSGNTGDENEATKVAVLVPHIGDQSYMDVTAHAEVLLEEKYGDEIEVNVIEMGDDEADWEPANRQAAEEGYDIIISGNWQYEAAMLVNLSPIAIVALQNCGGAIGNMVCVNNVVSVCATTGVTGNEGKIIKFNAIPCFAHCLIVVIVAIVAMALGLGVVA